MEHSLRAQINENMNTKETNELLEIWHLKDTDAWQEVVFDIAKEILIDRLGQIPPPSPEVQCKILMQKARAFTKEGNIDAALLACNQALQYDPDSVDGRKFFQSICKKKKQIERADRNFQISLSLDPGRTESWGNFLITEATLNEEFEDSPAKSHLDRALEFANAGKLEQAKLECEAGEVLLPDIALAYNYLGLIRETMFQTETAIKAYTRATKINPRFVPAWENLSNALRRFEEEQYFQTTHRSPEESQELSEMEFIMDGVDISEQPDSDDLIPGWYYLGESAFLLPGTPGYRIRPGRSGYDQLDTEFELARIQGIVIKKLLTGKFRTKDPVILAAMTIMGLVFCLPLALPFFLTDDFFIEIFVTYLLSSLYWLSGLGFLANVFLSILPLTDHEPDDDGCAFY